ncbi:hypothetical protein [Kitasatospora sp. MAP5-34]|uniref:hypothetical protein n=1 Tax=Kitasatospora sp. MAP5-34 TaxID=3035102 RepID=UPI002472FDEA|nr:hypothetical protein [Kitasatospora sp. MAP5-34]MDH6576979.1 hypothetical protein [Kitasatospora sp. MAP5-34]
MAGHQYGQFGPAQGGPYAWWGKLLCCLVPLLTLGLLGLVPSLLLAVRRRRAVDVLGAVFFGLLTLAAFVLVGLAPKSGTPSSTLLGFTALPLWLGAPVHFLVLDSPRFWGMPGPAPAPFVPGQVRIQSQPPQQAAQLTEWQPPVGVDTPVPASDDLQQLGELLRRQVREGGRP